MKNCLFLTCKDARYGFDLTGFNQEVTDGEQVLAVLESYVGKNESGLVIIDERLLEEKAIGRLQALEKGWGGTVIALPSPSMEEVDEQKDYAQRLIARVVGYQLKLR